MKLRTHKNSIRLRLSQSEVRTFAETGVVHECIAFSPLPSQQLQYSLIQAEHDHISVSYLNNHLRIYVPTAIARNWCESDNIGFDSHIPVGPASELYILVEKDFQCLTPRPYEDETDNFPNPNTEVCQ